MWPPQPPVCIPYQSTPVSAAAGPSQSLAVKELPLGEARLAAQRGKVCRSDPRHLTGAAGLGPEEGGPSLSWVRGFLEGAEALPKSLRARRCSGLCRAVGVSVAILPSPGWENVLSRDRSWDRNRPGRKPKANY